MSTDAKKPDAVKYPFGWDPGGTGMNSADRRHNYLSATLGGNPCVRVMPPAFPVFVTLDPYDTINFPTGHDLQGFPRYDWAEQPNGCSHGFLKPEAQPTS